jgi:hypothetical protein
VHWPVPSIQRKLFAHDLDRLGLAGAELFGAMNRLPKPAHERAGETTRPCGDEIFVAEIFSAKGIFAFA